MSLRTHAGLDDFVANGAEIRFVDAPIARQAVAFLRDAHSIDTEPLFSKPNSDSNICSTTFFRLEIHSASFGSKHAL